MVAAGTGKDFCCFPPGLSITAIDVSPAMIERARVRAASYQGTITLRVMNVQFLKFDKGTFDTVATACTFCSVPDPLAGLCELHRCLKPGGRHVMFEHVRSRIAPVAIFQGLMTLTSRGFGPEMNRGKVANALRAGFELIREENAYLDVVKAIEARKPLRGR